VHRNLASAAHYWRASGVMLTDQGASASFSYEPGPSAPGGSGRRKPVESQLFLRTGPRLGLKAQAQSSNRLKPIIQSQLI